jgi:ankyrin repeat protein
MKLQIFTLILLASFGLNAYKAQESEASCFHAYKNGTMTYSNYRQCMHNNYLLAAAQAGINLNNVKNLISYGANINVQDSEGMTPLMLAAQYGYPSVAQVLLAKGANRNLKNHYGHTALDIVFNNDNLAVFKAFYPKSYLHHQYNSVLDRLTNKAAAAGASTIKYWVIDLFDKRIHFGGLTPPIMWH